MSSNPPERNQQDEDDEDDRKMPASDSSAEHQQQHQQQPTSTTSTFSTTTRPQRGLVFSEAQVLHEDPTQFFIVGRGGVVNAHQGCRRVRRALLRHAMGYSAAPKARRDERALNLLQEEFANVTFVMQKSAFWRHYHNETTASSRRSKTSHRRLSGQRADSILSEHDNDLQVIQGYMVDTSVDFIAVGQDYAKETIKKLLAAAARKIREERGLPSRSNKRKSAKKRRAKKAPPPPPPSNTTTCSWTTARTFAQKEDQRAAASVARQERARRRGTAHDDNDKDPAEDPVEDSASLTKDQAEYLMEALLTSSPEDHPQGDPTRRRGPEDDDEAPPPPPPLILHCRRISGSAVAPALPPSSGKRIFDWPDDEMNDSKCNPPEWERTDLGHSPDTLLKEASLDDVPLFAKNEIHHQGAGAFFWRTVCEMVDCE